MSENDKPKTPADMPKRAIGQRTTDDGDRRADRRWRTLRKLALADRLPRRYWV